MTTPAPKRREVRRTHLDASAVPVERALLHRAERIEAGSGAAGCIAVGGGPSPLGVAVAAEFRALAEELHWH